MMAEKAVNSRLETFCDGVFAIAVTLLILDIRVPPLGSIHSTDDVWMSLTNLWPSFGALTLSFTIIFIAWYGHHNLLRNIDKTSTQFQFANGFFMFTIIFLPFPTAFMAEYLNTPFAQPAIEVYSLAAILHNIGWIVLNRSCAKPKLLLKETVDVSILHRVTRDGQIAFFVYTAIAILALWLPYIALTISVLIWVYWLYLIIKI